MKCRPVWAEMQCNLASNGCRTAMLSGEALVILEVCKRLRIGPCLRQHIDT